jgi:hypothetical protein
MIRATSSTPALIAAALVLGTATPAFAQVRVLFDAGHAQTAGNADWVIDEDTCDKAQRYPNPSQSNVTSSTSESYWSGAFSAFGIDLVKKGYAVESLPSGTAITYNDATNAQDLSLYDVFIIPEPNVRFTTAEKNAILAFVQAGGGLFMISDHANSDRNNDGWDSPEIFNDLGAPSAFGITFNTSGSYSYFDNNPDDNYTVDTSSPVVFAGAYGPVSMGKGLGLYGATALTLSTSNNATVAGHVWKTSGTAGSSTQVTFATASYGSGRVAAIGDSSPAEDATNSCGHTTYAGWTLSTFDNALIHLNAIAWLAGVTTGTAAPAAPTNLVTTKSATAGQVYLSWTDGASNETRFVVQRKTGSGSYKVVAILGANVTSYTDKSLTSGTTYTWRIAAINSGGSSAFSNTSSVAAP